RPRAPDVRAAGPAGHGRRALAARLLAGPRGPGRVRHRPGPGDLGHRGRAAGRVARGGHRLHHAGGGAGPGRGRTGRARGPGLGAGLRRVSAGGMADGARADHALNQGAGVASRQAEPARARRRAIEGLGLALAAALGFGGDSAAQARIDPATLEVPFVYEAERGAIVLEIVANHRPAAVLLDTGAARTVLSAEFVGLPKGRVDSARFSSDRPGIKAEGVWA